MYEHNALCYWSALALCLTKVRSSRARCPATALILYGSYAHFALMQYRTTKYRLLTLVDLFISFPAIYLFIYFLVYILP